MIKGMRRPGYLKFLKALQEDTGNNFSYLVPMDISQYLPEVEGDNLPQGKVCLFVCVEA